MTDRHLRAPPRTSISAKPTGKPEASASEAPGTRLCGVTGSTRVINRTRQQRTAARNAAEVQRTIGSEFRHAREDAGLSMSAVAAASGVAKSYLHGIEDGRRQPSSQVLARVAAALGGRLSIRFEPGAGPAVRDHLQAAMIEGLLPHIHRRWKRFLEVEVSRPVRGWIDLVLDDPVAQQLVAAEVHSRLDRIEQQLRWAKAKADALAVGGSSELTQVLQGASPTSVSRLLVLRLTPSTRALASTYGEILSAAYPASHQAALASLRDAEPWPGPAIVWMRVQSGRGLLVSRPPPLGTARS